jgi:hypothetical protein
MHAPSFSRAARACCRDRRAGLIVASEGTWVTHSKQVGGAAGSLLIVF